MTAGDRMAARDAFLDAAEGATALLGRGEVASAWDGDSVLAKFSVAGLAGHLLRGMTTVETYLAEPEPEGDGVTAHEYFHVLEVSPVVDHPVNQGIRTRGEEMAGAGPAGVARDARAVFGRLAQTLHDFDSGRRLRVAGGLVMGLDEYLQTRTLELVVHGDDLALSVDAPQPAFRAETTGLVIDTLVALARIRHGDLLVLRALARRERDEVEALRVL